MSLRTRFALAITAAATLVLALTSWLLFLRMRRGFVRHLEEKMMDHVSAMRQAVTMDPVMLHEAWEITTLTLGSDKLEKAHGSLSELGSNRWLMATPGYVEPSIPFPAALEKNATELRLTPGGPVFLTSAILARPGFPDLCYKLTVDASHAHDLETALRWELGGCVVLGALLSAALGYGIARRGLRPVNELLSEVERTTAQDLDRGPQAHAAWPSEFTRLSAAFNALRARLSQAFRQQRQFSDDAAHEMRTPVNNLLNLASLTLQRERSGEEYRATLVSAVEECERLRKLADGLLFIARSENAPHAVRITEFDAAEAIAEIVDYHEDIAAQREIQLHAESSGKLTADRMLFRQALTNLLSNAIRHSPNGGHIHICFSPNPATLTVTDEGDGIPPEHLPHVFDRFYRVDASRTQTAGAAQQTGLGLAIVKAIAELHGAKVSVESEFGKGSRFKLAWSC
jgi:heavy metal sensor kinase